MSDTLKINEQIPIYSMESDSEGTLITIRKEDYDEVCKQLTKAKVDKVERFVNTTIPTEVIDLYLDDDDVKTIFAAWCKHLKINVHDLKHRMYPTAENATGFDKILADCKRELIDNMLNGEQEQQIALIEIAQLLGVAPQLLIQEDHCFEDDGDKDNIVAKPIKTPEFTCPKCGSHEFGYTVIGDVPHGTCHGTIENEDSDNMCDFMWIRNTEEDSKVFS
jgi:hypothetical protein